MPQPNALRLVVWITLSSSLLGALFAYAENRPHGIADFVNTELHGVLAGGLNGGIPSSLEILVLRGAYGASLRQLPFLPYLALRSLLYLGIILLVLIATNLRVGVTRADIATPNHGAILHCARSAPFGLAWVMFKVGTHPVVRLFVNSDGIQRP